MKKIFVITLAVLGTFAFSSTSNAQTLVKNDGATITIEAGAVLFIEGGLENTNAGTIDNKGTIELEGDFDNSATYTGTADTLRFSGADDSDMTSGTAVIGVLELDKDATKNVNLLDNATVGTELNFVADNNKVSVGASDLIMQNGAVITSPDDNNFVMTNSTGFLTIEDIADGDTETFPVGAMGTTYNPLILTGATGHTTDAYSVRAIDSVYEDGLTGAAIEEGVVHASWELKEAVGGGTNLDVTAQWAGSDEDLISFDRANSAISAHDGTDWDLELGDLGAALGGDPYTRDRADLDKVGVLGIGSAGTPALAASVKVSIKVFLEGPFAAGVMGDALRSDGIIPSIEPYTAVPYSYTFEGYPTTDMANLSVFNDNGDNSNIVDWVIVELRDASNDTSVVQSVPALIQRSGNIVALDGVSELDIPGVSNGDYYLVVKHRNHLAVRSAATVSLDDNMTSYDFTDMLSKAYDNVSVAGNDAMKDFGGSVFGMFAGDANTDGQVKFIGGGNDKSVILTTLGPGNDGAVLADYRAADLNMNGDVRFIGGGNDKSVILTALGPGNAGGVLVSHINY